jgi:hypothetical protein
MPADDQTPDLRALAAKHVHAKRADVSEIGYL